MNVKSLSHVRLFATPWTVARQTPLSMGFSRQEHWSGLPCPPPRGLPIPGMKPRSPILLEDSLPAEPPGKLKNTGVGSPSLFQGIFLTQELNWGLLHCKWILYQLSDQGRPQDERSHLLFIIVSKIGSYIVLSIKLILKNICIFELNYSFYEYIPSLLFY